MSEDNESEPQKWRNLFYLSFAYICIGFAVVGAILPLIPTIPFLLLVAWAAQKGSPTLHLWLYEHPKIGSILIAWKQSGAIPTSAKCLACSLMAVSWITIYTQASTCIMPSVMGVLFVLVAGFIVTRPAPLYTSRIKTFQERL